MGSTRAGQASAGLLLYRDGGREVFLVHPGGPYWAKKDTSAWSIPKGGIEDGEAPLEAARRELREETGIEIDPSAAFVPLRPVRQRSGKMVRAWLVEHDCDAAAIRSESFTMEWPPRSGVMQRFPEVDRAAWFTLDEARTRLLAAQVDFIDQLVDVLGVTER